MVTKGDNTNAKRSRRWACPLLFKKNNNDIHEHYILIFSVSRTSLPYHNETNLCLVYNNGCCLLTPY